jgi:hypothetical protein
VTIDNAQFDCCLPPSGYPMSFWILEELCQMDLTRTTTELGSRPRTSTYLKSTEIYRALQPPGSSTSRDFERVYWPDDVSTRLLVPRRNLNPTLKSPLTKLISQAPTRDWSTNILKPSSRKEMIVNGPKQAGRTSRNNCENHLCPHHLLGAKITCRYQKRGAHKDYNRLTFKMRFVC